MKRILITATLVAAGSLTLAADTFADHNRAIRRDFEIRRVELEHEFKARREANTYAYHRERDLLRAQRARAVRMDCRDTRALRLRAVNRDQAALSRDYALSNRELITWYHNERDALRTSYEIARRDARQVVTRPVVVESAVHAHPADCECNVCNPAAAVVEPVVCDELGCSPLSRAGYDDYGYGYRRRTVRRTSPNALDIAGLVLSLLK